jgi:multisubunit Na+/H+ antiporter MnhC subunit
MSDPRTFWLIVTNIVLGLAVVVLVLGVLTGVVCEFAARLSRRHTMSDELDEDMRRMFHGSRHR